MNDKATDVRIHELQAYLADHYGKRGNEQSLFMKLVEETGEVAEVLNRRAGRKQPGEGDLQAELASELADVIHYTVAIAAINGIDLSDAILRKDARAALKYHHKTDLESFIRRMRAE